MKTLTTLAALALTLPAAFAGDLTPPAGPVAPTMKTLDEVEARRPVEDLPGDATYAHIISEPGSYILTADLVTDKVGGIRVDAGNVTLDLQGFTMTSSVWSTGSMHAGVSVPVNMGAIVVRNGILRGFHCGVMSNAPTVAEDLRITGTSSIDMGVGIDLGSRSAARRCHVSDFGFGIDATRVEDCDVSSCDLGITGSLVVVRNRVSGNLMGVELWSQAGGLVADNMVLDDIAIWGPYTVRNNHCGGNLDAVEEAVIHSNTMSSFNGSSPNWAPVSTAAAATHPLANIQL